MAALVKSGVLLVSFNSPTRSLSSGVRFFTALPSHSKTKSKRRLFCTSLEAAETSSAADAPPIRDAASALDIRVGRILNARRHPEADSLYVEEVDLGEAEPRTICSGLVNYIPLHDLQDIKVVVLANLKPRNMRGIKSKGMLMAASDASHENVELLLPPEGSIPGERIWFGSDEEKENQLDAATPNQA
eukprot:TRINITY_DN1327_c0_g1_i1.p1 TRINITY_DN1327_c0_g1~~TRINITY_DN1327_c0_g1_i1.p1  ORF type:complete len:188 (+),score=31.42 TRINITY_DN1327_c0_g1_i1:42-605(+)